MTDYETANELAYALEDSVLRSWSDPPERGRSADDWPYPDSYMESAPPESLRSAVLNRLGRDDGTVILRTRTASCGWSEYTQEDDYDATVLVDDVEVYTTPIEGSMGGALVSLLKWLDD